MVGNNRSSDLPMNCCCLAGILGSFKSWLLRVVLLFFQFNYF